MEKRAKAFNRDPVQSLAKRFFLGCVKLLPAGAAVHATSVPLPRFTQPPSHFLYGTDVMYGCPLSLQLAYVCLSD